MPTFSRVSEERLQSCHQDLQRVARMAIAKIDFVVLCGHRSQELQDQAFKDGHSKVPWPKSRHNPIPSEAMDLSPYPIDWENLDRFKALAVIVIQAAKSLGVDLEWGGEWIGFPDFPHYQLRRNS